jgi:hypothetical protein
MSQAHLAHEELIARVVTSFKECEKVSDFYGPDSGPGGLKFLDELKLLRKFRVDADFT